VRKPLVKQRFEHGGVRLPGKLIPAKDLLISAEDLLISANICYFLLKIGTSSEAFWSLVRNDLDLCEFAWYF
jgi:hypothetical protein